MVPGGGAVETALCEYLECFAITLGSREQLAIAEFAESLTVIPKVLHVWAIFTSHSLCYSKLFIVVCFLPLLSCIGASC